MPRRARYLRLPIEPSPQEKLERAIYELDRKWREKQCPDLEGRYRFFFWPAGAGAMFLLPVICLQESVEPRRQSLFDFTSPGKVSSVVHVFGLSSVYKDGLIYAKDEVIEECPPRQVGIHWVCKTIAHLTCLPGLLTTVQELIAMVDGFGSAKLPENATTMPAEASAPSPS